MNNRRFENVKRIFCNDRATQLSLIFLVLVIVSSIVVAMLPIDPNAIDIGNMLQEPSLSHIFGTDELGRDYFIRVLNGAKVSLIVGVLAMATSVVIGVTLGIISGYFGGLVDSIIMRTVDVFCSVPWIIMVTVVSLIFKKGLFSIILVIGLFSWMEIARLVRSETMSAKNREYVQYAELIGVPKWTIMTKHILPSIYPLIITSATSAIANAIMVESAMSFLGIGIQAPMASWGSLLQTAQTNLAKAPYMAFIPGILIVLTICSFNKLGDLLRIYV
ncbi:MAG: ABC transporter permease, partial [Peptacetobacter hiranonis]|nr:ABC transporter permease [Peptacetobacter hiranonis]